MSSLTLMQKDSSDVSKARLDKMYHLLDSDDQLSKKEMVTNVCKN